MLYTLALYIIGCLAVGHLIAHGHASAWFLIPFCVLGIVAIQVGYCATYLVENWGD